MTATGFVAVAALVVYCIVTFVMWVREPVIVTEDTDADQLGIGA